MLKYPIGEQTFEKIINKGCVYVDKTEYVYNLANAGSTFYLLSRPHEYDKPLTATMFNDTLNDKFREELRAFYGVLKSQDANIRFAILTGVTKFSKISIFSDKRQNVCSSLRHERKENIQNRSEFLLPNENT